MRDYLPFLIIGVVTGSVYGLSAMGLVLTYTTSGIFNFGHGAIAAASAMAFYQLRQQEGVPWPLAAVIAVCVFGVLCGVLVERLALILAEVPTAYRVVGTVGLIVSVPAIYNLVYTSPARQFQTFLPQRVALTIQGVSLSYDNVLTPILGVVSAAGLYAFFRKSRLGTSMRAVVDDSALLDLTGESPTRVRRAAWIIGCMFASVSGILLASTQQQLDASLLSLLVIQAFGAAVVGAFTNLPLAYAGGLLLGVVQALSGKFVGEYPALQGLDTNMPFLFLFVGLLVIPRPRLQELGRAVRLRPPVRSDSGSSRRAAIGIGLLAAVVVPYVVDTKLASWNSAMALIPLFLSLGLLVRTSGQISLCQVGFAAIGATTFAHAYHAGIPWLGAVLLAGLVTLPVGAAMSIPAIRLSGLYLALATLGFGILLAQFAYTKDYMFGQGALESGRPAVDLLSSDRGYYFVLLGFVVLSCIAVVLVERSRLGRLLRGMADSPTALATLGTSVNVSRVLVFCISAYLAGLSGALTAGLLPAITADVFPYFASLIVMTVLIITGRRTIASAVLAALLYRLPPAYISGDHVGDWLQLAFGVAAIGAAVLVAPNVRAALAEAAARRPGGLPPRPVVEPAAELVP